MNRGLALAASLLIVAPLLLTVVPVALAGDDTASIAGVWTGSGPIGTTATTTRDGTGGVAEFKYEKNLGVAGGVPLTTWTFQTTAAQTGTVNLAYTLEGLHAWFNVTVGLTTFRNASTVETLIADGPVSCCTPPSNGFSYEGTASIPVTAGDTFGFKISGSNGDSNSFLRGTLRVATNLIKNGSFENPVVPGPGGFKVVPTETTIPNWTVDAGDLELLNSLYWNAADGGQSIDLDGATAAGTVSQVFSTIVGQDYNVSFMYSANPEGAQPDPSMVVKANGAQLGAAFTHAKGSDRRAHV